MNVTDLSPEELADMLVNLNLDTARKLHPEFSDDGLLGGIHKARYELCWISTKLRNESAEWLRSRNFGRVDGSDLLPIGELP